jgi:type IV pilus assembly protein PilE
MELLTVVAIIGILAAISYPAYTNSLIKGTRGNAKSLLLDVAQKEQVGLLDRRAYVAAADCDALTTAVGVSSDALVEVKKYYTCSVTASNGPPPTYTAKLTPIAGQRMAADGWLQIDQTGAKTSEKPGNF